MNKYGEPWYRLGPLGMLANGDEVLFSRDTKRLDRIVACVNACAGIPHPEKLPELMEAIKREIGFLEPEIQAAFSAVMGET